MSGLSPGLQGLLTGARPPAASEGGGEQLSAGGPATQPDRMQMLCGGGMGQRSRGPGTAGAGAPAHSHRPSAAAAAPQPVGAPGS